VALHHRGVAFCHRTENAQLSRDSPSRQCRVGGRNAVGHCRHIVERRIEFHMDRSWIRDRLRNWRGFGLSSEDDGDAGNGRDLQRFWRPGEPARWLGRISHASRRPDLYDRLDLPRRVNRRRDIYRKRVGVCQAGRACCDRQAGNVSRASSL